LNANPPRPGGASRSPLAGVLTGLTVALLSLPALGADGPTPASPSDPTSLQSAFAAAASEFGVPESVLLSVSYNVSRWETHGGAPSFTGGYGPMHLVDVDNPAGRERKGDDDEVSESGTIDLDDPSFHTLDAAAELLGVAPEELKRDPAQNIRGGAALLKQYARYALGREPAGVEDWYAAVALFSGSSEDITAIDFANTVYSTIRKGASRTTLDGQTVTLTAEAVSPNTQAVAVLPLSVTASSAVECPDDLACEVVPAGYAQNSSRASDYGNYDLADRPANGLDIRYIVIHDTEVDYNTTLKLFKNPKYFASSHYVIRSADGHIAQMVPTTHIPWHAGNWDINAHGIGIEHEGVAIEGAAWYNEQFYRASARLVRYLAARFNVPLDREHIVGHDNIPGTTAATQARMHWDPGPFWDWTHYMRLVREEEEGEEGEPGKLPHPNKSVVTIAPHFRKNTPAMTYCYTATDCRPVPLQPSNFVYLYTAPRFDAPYIANPFIGADPTRASNWSNKAAASQQFVLADRQGDWSAIYFSGQKAWFYNPQGKNTKSGRGLIIKPKAGLASIPLYGRAYPEAAAYPPGINPQVISPLTPYSIPAGQLYVATGPYPGQYYYSPTYIPKLEGSDRKVVTGQTLYYQVSYNHRFAYVKASDVEVVSGE
jgi:N-acetyl-anhydromuramyl-L-alanine amidase AmpD